MAKSIKPISSKMSRRKAQVNDPVDVISDITLTATIKVNQSTVLTYTTVHKPSDFLGLVTAIGEVPNVSNGGTLTIIINSDIRSSRCEVSLNYSKLIIAEGIINELASIRNAYISSVFKESNDVK